MGERESTSAARRLAWVQGMWVLRREIEDRRAGEAGVFEGEAAFVPEAGRLVYQERGTLRLPGRPPLAAERSYLWAACEEAIAVSFADGRAFHRFAPEGGTAVHDCAPDVYRVQYRFDGAGFDRAGFEGADRWEAVWDVEGPRKDYTLRTRYRRG